MKVIGITGVAQTGKNTVAQYLHDRYGYSIYSFVKYIDRELKKQRKEISKENESKLGDELREKFGKEAIAKLLWSDVEKKKPEKTVLVGLRSAEEAEFIKKNSDEFYLIEVVADEDVRFQRRTKLDPHTKAEFLARDERDVEKKGLGKVCELADFTVENNHDFEHLYKQVDELMEKWIGVK